MVSRREQKEEARQRRIAAERALTEGSADPQLPCYGCAHSAAIEPFPGRPSGERPCGFCIRNPEGEADWVKEHGARWYNQTPAFKTPMDCYIATDRSTQQHILNTLADYALTGDPIPERERFEYNTFSGDEDGWCCEGGDGPKGHTWTCWRWLGITYG